MVGWTRRKYASCADGVSTYGVAGGGSVAESVAGADKWLLSHDCSGSGFPA